MSKITLIKDSEKEWREPSAEWQGKAKPGAPSLKYKSLIDYQHGQLNMQRSVYEPGHLEPPHSHPEDEIIYVLSGKILFGDQALEAGDSLYIERQTMYSLRATEAGAEFLRVGLPL